MALPKIKAGDVEVGDFVRQHPRSGYSQVVKVVPGAVSSYISLGREGNRIRPRNDKMLVGYKQPELS
jgi:hypothetical protein